MKYAFNIDNSLINMNEFLLENAPDYMKEHYKLDVANLNGKTLDQMFSVEKSIKYFFPLLSEKEVNDRVQTIEDQFWLKFYPSYLANPFRSGVKETINQLYESGNTIYLIETEKLHQNTLYKKLYANSGMIQAMLNGVKYHKIISFNNENEMIDGIKKRRIDVVVDDRADIIENICNFTDVLAIKDCQNQDIQKENVVLVDSYNTDFFEGIKKIVNYNNEPLKSIPYVLTNSPSQDKVWLKYYKRKDLKYTLDRKNPYDRMYDMHMDHPNDAVFSYSTTKKKLTANDLYSKVDKCAAWLQSQGVGKGDFVPVLALNTFEAIIMIMAIMKIKATVVPIAPTETEKSIYDKISELKPTPKLMYIVDHYNPKLKEHFTPIVEKLSHDLGIKKVVYSKLDFSSLTLTSKEKMGMILNIITDKHMFNSMLNYKYNDNFIKYEDILGQNLKYQQPLEEDNDLDYTAAIIYTSGSEKSKGVMLTPRSIDAELVQYFNSILNLKRNEKISCFLPFDHVFGLIIGIMVTIVTGMEGVIVPNFSRDKAGNLIFDDNVDYFTTIPILLDAILKDERSKKKFDMKLKKVFSGSQTLSKATINNMQSFFDNEDSAAKIVDGYGSSEGTCVALIDGVPILNADFKIVEQGTEKELSYNQTGEFCFSSETMLKGYYNMPEKTKEALRVHEDGKLWYHTGDLAFVDPDGKFHYQGRMKSDFIKVNGHQVYLYKLKQLIEANSSVQECLVIGRPDDRRGNIPVVFVRVEENFNELEILKQKLLELCKNNLEFHELPKDIYIVNQFPLKGRGKIDIKLIEDNYESIINNESNDLMCIRNIEKENEKIKRHKII